MRFVYKIIDINLLPKCIYFIKIFIHITGADPGFQVRGGANLAVLSELGRYPLYFSVVLSMLTYWFRIDKMESGLLSDAYIAIQSMVSDNTECWLSSIKFILGLWCLTPFST
jgi:hypothetical protein